MEITLDGLIISCLYYSGISLIGLPDSYLSIFNLPLTYFPKVLFSFTFLFKTCADLTLLTATSLSFLV